MGPRTTPAVVLVMGVAGCGKTTVGRALAMALEADLVEGDDYHSPENIERMRRGLPLDDAARAPWLRDLHAAIVGRVRSGGRIVLACSALKATYRAMLLDAIADPAVVFLRADRDVLEQRLRARTGHFMPASLLDSQLADLEEPQDAIVVDAGVDPARAVDEILQALGPDP